MVTFFIIFFVLILVNAAVLAFSALNANQKIAKLTKTISEQSPIKIYPLDTITSNYKKAI